MKDISFTQNRELSWLEFNRRVIDEARDKTVPLLERLKFISIWDSNLEEFFMVRIGSLTDLSKLKKQAVCNKSNMTPREQIDAVLKKLIPMYKEKDEIYFDLLEDLRASGMNMTKVRDLGEADKNNLKAYFDSKVEPILSFQIIDKTHPLPRLANLSLSVIFKLKDCDDRDKEIRGIVYVPDRIPRYMRISKSNFVLLEDMIKEFGSDLFEGYLAKDPFVMSLTRNADVSFDDDDYDVDEDFRAYMKKKLKKRKKLQPVRIEIDEVLDRNSYDFLRDNFGIEKESIFLTKAPMQLGFVYELVDSLPAYFRDEHSYDDFSPQPSSMVDQDMKMVDQIMEKDLILSYPYESMDSMIRLIDEAAEDPLVDSIKITLYRIAKDSKIAQSLIKAAENGKEVIALMELRARFDESNNILWSSRLQEAGCKIVYGFDHYKAHCKVLLITRIDKKGEISFISQVAKGNYNEKTAKLYTDFSFMTSDKIIGQDAKDLFDNILIGNLEGDYNKLMVAPKSLQEGLKHHINEEIRKAEAGEDAYIRLKMNSISDRKTIDLLSRASNAGVKIDMMVRGITCILPGIEDRTENIDIYQIVGRFLEHHRVYQFGKDKPKLYISSADFMTRNIRKRMEVAVPIEDLRIKKYIMDFLDIMFSDDVKIRRLGPDGLYHKIENINNINCQEELMEAAIKRARAKSEKSDENYRKTHAIKNVRRTGIGTYLKNIFKKYSK